MGKKVYFFLPKSLRARIQEYNLKCYKIIDEEDTDLSVCHEAHIYI